MKLMSSSTARRRTANAPLRSFGGPQMPSPVRRIAPKPRRCTEISPPSETFPAAFAESSFLFMIDLQNSSLGLSNADRHRFSSFAGRWGHEFRPDWIANTFAKNDFDRGEITFCQRPAAYLIDGRELFRTTCPPERDANARLVEQPANRQMNHAFAKVFASICIQFARRDQVLCEMWLLKLGVTGLAHVVFRKLATCTHRAT